MFVGERNRDRAARRLGRRAGLSFSPAGPVRLRRPAVRPLSRRRRARHPERDVASRLRRTRSGSSTTGGTTSTRTATASPTARTIAARARRPRSDGCGRSSRSPRKASSSKAASVLGVRDIEFESEEFNRTFYVTCEDRKFANVVPRRADDRPPRLDARASSRWRCKNRWMLLYTKRLKGNELAAALQAHRDDRRPHPPPRLRDVASQ